MEDAYLARFNIAPEISLFAIFDGHGGYFLFTINI